jgi:hypothetical protein
MNKDCPLQQYAMPPGRQRPHRPEAVFFSFVFSPYLARYTLAVAANLGLFNAVA